MAVNAFGGGYYGMAGARNIPVEWLKGSPFRNYFIPGLVLFTCIGGSALLAAILIFTRHPMAQKAVFSCGLVVLVWLMAQVAIIGYVSWIQPATAAVANLILLLTWRLPKI